MGLILVRNKIWTISDYNTELANIRWKNTVLRLRIQDALVELNKSSYSKAINILKDALEAKD